MDVPIEMRSHEQEQMETFLPEVEETLRERGLHEQADEIGNFTFTLDATDDVAGQYASAPAEDWEKVVQYLNIIRPNHGLKVWWLRKKLAMRLSERLAEVDAE